MKVGHYIMVERMSSSKTCSARNGLHFIVWSKCSNWVSQNYMLLQGYWLLSITWWKGFFAADPIYFCHWKWIISVGAQKEASPLLTSVHGGRRYSAYAQRIKVTIYITLVQILKCVSLTCLQGRMINLQQKDLRITNHFYLIELKAHSVHTWHC